VEVDESTAIEKHLSAFSDRLRQGLAVALVLLVAGMAYTGEIDLLGLKIPRHLAIFMGSWVFLFFQFSMLDKALRIRDMIKAVPDATLPSLCRAIGLHSWSANPFALFGSSGLALMSSAKSLGLLLLAYIVLNSWLLAFGKRSAGAVGVFAPFVLPTMSLITLALFWNTKREMRKRLTSSDPDLAQTLARQSRYEWIWVVGFLVVGLLFCMWVALLNGQIV
jgi:hypothetical protein